MSDDRPLDDEKLFSGFILGLFIGVLVGLVKAPRIRLDDFIQSGHVEKAGSALRDTLEAVKPADTVGSSIAEGKEAARRRRSELGLDD
jgi:hypothetical protein